MTRTMAQGEVGALRIGARLAMVGDCTPTVAEGAKLLLETVRWESREAIIESPPTDGGGVRSSNTTTMRSRRRLAERILTL